MWPPPRQNSLPTLGPDQRRKAGHSIQRTPAFRGEQATLELLPVGTPVSILSSLSHDSQLTHTEGVLSSGASSLWQSQEKPHPTLICAKHPMP